MDGPEGLSVVLEQVIHVEFVEFGVFKVRHDTAMKSEESDTSSVHISSSKIRYFLGSHLRGSKVRGALVKGFLISDLALSEHGELEIDELELELVGEDHIFGLDVHMGDAILVKVLHGVDKLGKVGSGHLRISTKLNVLGEGGKVGEGSEFHVHDRIHGGGVLADDLLLLDLLDDVDDVGVVKASDLGLLNKLLVVNVGLRLTLNDWEEFQSKVFVG
mmetsp:Transcript_11689/g.16424  ORF Transcript_11689/g.16424 Transcript_11689/m.16424 type:complete len:217 (+) Transcript_11689:267-917(+)